MKKGLSILFIIMLCLALLTGCNEKKDQIPTEIVFMKGFPTVIDMYEGEELNDNYVMFKGIVDFKNNNVIFVSSDEKIVRVDVSTQEFPIYTYFDIEAVSVGEAIIYAQSVDGSVISEPIKINVLEKETKEDSTESTTTSETEPEVPSAIESETQAITESESVTETQTETDIEKEAETYILNTNSKKYHTPSCSFVTRMNEANKAEFCGDDSELIAQGYSACKSCKP